MCGIAAIFSRQKDISGVALQRAMAQLVHRGPDSQRHWLAPNRRVGLGHTRLSIIDLTTGDQPIANEDETLRIIVNGEFYDFERQRRELEMRGHRFRTRSDSEIALHLYEEFGTDCLSHLRGEFAFVVWDSANQIFFAARDRFGIKPLHYAFVGDTLYVASEAKALFAAGVPARWDRESFFQYAGSGLSLPNRTFFEGVFQVPPGHYLMATGNSFQILRYWDFDYPRASDLARPLPDAAYIEQFHDTLNEAVRIRMRADVPVGCYLSGGLDSCSVLGMAATHTSTPIQAFTLTFDQKDYDEGKIAEQMAARAGARFCPIPIKQSDIADHLTDALWHSETLFINGHGVSKFLLSRAVHAAGYKVVFTGEGSDEIMGGYAHFRRDMLLYNTQGQDAAQAENLLRELELNNRVSTGILLPSGEQRSLDAVRRTLGFVPTYLETIASAAHKTFALLADDFMAEFGERDGYQMALNGLDVHGQLAGRDPVNQSLYIWSKSNLPNYILNVLGDRMEMAHSVEGRVPFLDHRVVECLRNVPVALKIRGMTEKYILREAARPFLTDTVYRRQKHPFLSPPVALAPTERLNELLQDTLRGPVLAALPFCNRGKVIALLDRLDSMEANEAVPWDPVLMGILSACILQQKFKL